jgi:hypothetical protein
VKASIAIRDIADAFSFGGPRPTPTGRWRSPYRPDTFIHGCAFAQKRRPFRLSYKHADRRKRGDGNQRGLTMNILEKIAIFGLLTIASISVVVVVLPCLPMNTQIFLVSADTEPFLGQ